MKSELTSFGIIFSDADVIWRQISISFSDGSSQDLDDSIFLRLGQKKFVTLHDVELNWRQNGFEFWKDIFFTLSSNYEVQYSNQPNTRFIWIPDSKFVRTLSGTQMV